MDNKVHSIAYIIGMPRAGTTFLYHNLSKHPKIYVPFRRKTNFFSLHHEKSEEWFISHFNDMPEGQIGIDTETLFFANKYLKSYKKILDLNPDAKVMLFVRKPDEWVYSFYKQIATFDKDICTFKDFLDGKYTLIEDNKPIPFNIQDGDLKTIIEDIRNSFGNNVLVVNFTLFEKDPLKLLQTIESFLGITSFFNTENFKNEKINSSNRAHNQFIANLLRQQWLISFLSMLPTNFVKNIRMFYDTISSKLSTDTKDQKQDTNIELANQYFQEDIKYYHSLFKNSDIL